MTFKKGEKVIVASKAHYWHSLDVGVTGTVDFMDSMLTDIDGKRIYLISAGRRQYVSIQDLKRVAKARGARRRRKEKCQKTKK